MLIARRVHREEGSNTAQVERVSVCFFFMNKLVKEAAQHLSKTFDMILGISYINY